MVEFHFFSDRNFLGAVVVALIVSFAMLGVFFFLALYMQNILGYSALEAGIRFLPSTLMIVVVAPIAGRLADRIGPRWLIAAGLTIVAASLYTFSGIAVDSSYGELLPGFMLLGIGIATTMSPMTTAAMNAVAVEKAGIASGVLSMFRMIGGSLGVAVTGAIFQGAVGDPETASPADFVDALGHAMEISAALALAGGVFGAIAIRAKKKSVSPTEAEAAVAMSPGPRDRASAASRP
jgi:MFS family permease